ncbi:QueT transporter family protein [Candidatus Bathyarchaeota archaeon]|nr:QueT transporter family protein [Candidatus Bathyarchaeota archaeon]MBS7630171.1 QueT transporter family protein [Candidatus Bathyarchaeota archaeon]
MISNAYYWLGPLDVILEPLANLISAATIYYFRRRLFIACLLGALLVGIVVDGYLWIYFPPPDFPISPPSGDR